MISDKYILKYQPEDAAKILDISEHMAACYGFNAKELLMIRLLTEEMISALQSALMVYRGEIWFGSQDGMFTITASVNTDISGMPLDQRKQLKKLGSPHKKAGIFGLVREYMDFLFTSEEGVSIQNYIGSHYHGCVDMYSENVFDEAWHMNLEAATWYKPAPAEKSENDDIDIELSLLQGYADDIKVSSKRGSLELTVMKCIPVLFSFNYLAID